MSVCMRPLVSVTFVIYRESCSGKVSFLRFFLIYFVIVYIYIYSIGYC